MRWLAGYPWHRSARASAAGGPAWAAAGPNNADCGPSWQSPACCSSPSQSRGGGWEPHAVQLPGSDWSPGSTSSPACCIRLHPVRASMSCAQEQVILRCNQHLHQARRKPSPLAVLHKYNQQLFSIETYFPMSHLGRQAVCEAVVRPPAPLPPNPLLCCIGAVKLFQLHPSRCGLIARPCGTFPVVHEATAPLVLSSLRQGANPHNTDIPFHCCISLPRMPRRVLSAIPRPSQGCIQLRAATGMTMCLMVIDLHHVI